MNMLILVMPLHSTAAVRLPVVIIIIIIIIIMTVRTCEVGAEFSVDA
jgi:hypothetical protein